MAKPVVVTATSEPTAAPVLPTPTSDLLPLPTPTVPPTITPTPRPTATPEVTTGISLTVSVLQNQKAWVRVVVDGEVAEENTLSGGTTRSWEANSSLTIRTGNGGGVGLVLNGEDLGRMGAVGQVVERTWVIDQGEVTEAATGAPTQTKAPAKKPATPTPAG